MTTVNKELLKRTLQHIETHPDEWAQERWVTKTDCGTSYCFAGWALTLAGVPIHSSQLNPPVVEINKLHHALAQRGASVTVDPDNYWTNTHMTVRDAAEVLLGIQERDLHSDDGYLHAAADILFEADNSLDDLREYVAELCATTETAASQ